MKYLIVGLGNPGLDYQNTRHNIGFKVIDAIAHKQEAVFTADRYADVSNIKHKSRSLHLIKPNTFMNLSGKAVNYWSYKLKIGLDKILVINDDLDLKFGELRLRAKGSPAGHNGLKHISSTFGTNSFARLRFGIGDNFARGKQIEYVLGNWTKKEDNFLEEYIFKAIEIVESFCTNGVDRTMNIYNRK
jgi:PTH1 family peptidyl-tRNA hydrolase